MIFGHQDDKHPDGGHPSGAPISNSFVVGAGTDGQASIQGNASDNQMSTSIQPMVTPSVQPPSLGTEENEESDSGAVLSDVSSEQGQDSSMANQPAEATYGQPTENNESVLDQGVTSIPDELLDLKQKALSDLGPLVHKLDQTPEEKFRTTMMMIQSTDNQDLIKDAYAAAQAITDDKVRAQALLDVVNEINYFIQHNGQ